MPQNTTENPIPHPSLKLEQQSRHLKNVKVRTVHIYLYRHIYFDNEESGEGGRGRTNHTTDL